MVEDTPGEVDGHLRLGNLDEGAEQPLASLKAVPKGSSWHGIPPFQLGLDPAPVGGL